MLDTNQLECILSNISEGFNVTTGVLPCDEVHTVESSRFAIIINSDPHYLPGTHWLAFFRDSPDSVFEFYDSLAQDPSSYGEDFINFIKLQGGNCRRSLIQIQDVKQTTCGNHCVFYLYKRLRGFLMDEIVNEFDHKDLTKNDHFVVRFTDQVIKSTSNNTSVPTTNFIQINISLGNLQPYPNYCLVCNPKIMT